MVASTIPTLETKTVSEARRTFSETLNRVYRGETRVLIEKNGIPVAVPVSPRDMANIEEMQRRRDDLRAALRNTRAAFDGVPIEEVDREVDKAIEEVEARRHRKDPDPTVTGVADDEEGDLVLGTAVAAGAGHLVTGDTGLRGRIPRREDRHGPGVPAAHRGRVRGRRHDPAAAHSRSRIA